MLSDSEIQSDSAQIPHDHFLNAFHVNVVPTLEQINRELRLNIEYNIYREMELETSIYEFDSINIMLNRSYIPILNYCNLKNIPTYCFNSDTDHQCYVCLNDIKKNTTIYIFECFHFFCAACTEDVVKKSKCPICRKKLEPNKILKNMDNTPHKIFVTKFEHYILNIIKQDLDTIDSDNEELFDEEEFKKSKLLLEDID